MSSQNGPSRKQSKRVSSRPPSLLPFPVLNRKQDSLGVLVLSSILDGLDELPTLVENVSGFFVDVLLCVSGCFGVVDDLARSFPRLVQDQVGIHTKLDLDDGSRGGGGSNGGFLGWRWFRHEGREEGDGLGSSKEGEGWEERGREEERAEQNSFGKAVEISIFSRHFLSIILHLPCPTIDPESTSWFLCEKKKTEVERKGSLRTSYLNLHHLLLPPPFSSIGIHSCTAIMDVTTSIVPGLFAGVCIPFSLSLRLAQGEGNRVELTSISTFLPPFLPFSPVAHRDDPRDL